MQKFSLSEICELTDGELFCPEHLRRIDISGVITDSRTYFGGTDVVFFALTGPVNNGHNYILSLQERGVQVFVVSDKRAITEDCAFVLVENTTVALQKLAAVYRQKFTYPVLAITGSNGKTIVKEWLYDILSTKLSIVRSPKSYNSQIGVPLSVLLMDKQYELGVFEAGISKPNEMCRLAEIIAPEIGILTNIGDAHQENFLSVEQKVSEKLLLFKGCKKLVFCVDDHATEKIIDDFCNKYSIEKYNWGLGNKKALINFKVNKGNGLCSIVAVSENSTSDFQIPFSDDSAIENACHCFCAICALNQNPKEFVSQFSKLQPVAMRLEIKKGINNCLLINDYYNSDLNSLTIALSVLQQQAAQKHQSTQVILSDIQQTGLEQTELYKKVNQLFCEWCINKVIGIGPEISANKDAFTIDSEFYSSRSSFEQAFLRGKFYSSAILIKGARSFEFEKISGLLQQKAHQSVLEIQLNALVNNLNVFRGLLASKTKIMVMVKAFSYGSGDVEIAQLLQYQNIDYLAVAVADEGMQLRNAGIRTPIIVMNPEHESFQNMIDYRLEPNVYTYSLLVDFAKAVSHNGQKDFPVHLKIDTGMNRLGMKSEAEIYDVVEFIKNSEELKVQSVFSHLAASDEPGLDDFTHSQIAKFEVLSELILNTFDYPIDRHILNSAGIERFTEKQFDMVRLGIGLYGVSQTGLPLENIGTLKSSISQVKNVDANETIGYSRKGTLSHESKIAVVPMGYADGIDRKLGNRNGEAFVNGERVPIVGNICMDMLMLDVTNVDASPGDSVEFFGANISVSELAEKTGTIPYEVLTGISQRVKRIYLQE